MIQVLVVEDSRITRDAIESQIAKSERYECRFDPDGCLHCR